MLEGAAHGGAAFETEEVRGKVAGFFAAAME